VSGNLLHVQPSFACKGLPMRNTTLLLSIAILLAAACVQAWSSSDSKPPPSNSDMGGSGGGGKGGAAGSAGTAGSAGKANGGSAGSSGGGGSAGTAGVAGSAGSGGGCSCGPLEQCWNGQFCVAKSVVVSIPDAGATYEIDATEVTRSQYEGWLATNPDPKNGQDNWCAWNTSFSASPACLADPPACQANCGNHPQTCVDWCDAYAFCKAIGKRLCGKIGGGPNGYVGADQNDANKDQWYNVCSTGGVSAYPYGNGYGALLCNGTDNGVGSTMAVGSNAICVTAGLGYEGVYDLSGNVWEWEDACDGTTGKSDSCRVRGGAFSGPNVSLRCDYTTSNSRDYPYGNAVGFRCCSQ
jgi:formylglycine-generating enzyme